MQFGGDDQWSNMLAGSELIRKKTGRDAYSMTITLLLNSQGKKMGKTAQGAVWLDKNKTSVYDFYQYWRNVEDDDVLKCIRMLTFLPLDEIEKMDNWQGAELNKAKEILAFELTKLVHGEDEALVAQNTAKAIFVNGVNDSNMPQTKINLNEDEISLADVLVQCNLASSKGEAKRLIQQGGVTIDDKKITDFNYKIKKEELNLGIVIKKGKKVYHKAII